MKNHTPGPWYISKTAGDDWVIYPESNPDKDLALVYQNSRGTDPIEAKDTALVIALTPEFLRALRAIKARIQGEFDNPDLVSFGALEADSDDTVLRILNTVLHD